MTTIDIGCWERGCACYDSRIKDETVEVVRRDWVGLTDDEIVLIVAECAASHQHTDIHFARAIEAKLKEKNT
jgi:hypothetical protein